MAGFSLIHMVIFPQHDFLKNHNDVAATFCHVLFLFESQSDISQQLFSKEVMVMWL
jgi:hypothetical protein